MSLLVGDDQSERAREQILLLAKPLMTSELVDLEYVNGVRQRVFRGELTEKQALDVEREFVLWKREGRLVQSRAVVPELWELALRLSREHTARLGTRSLDALHVAFALAAEAELFCSFDKKQRALAAVVGMALNP